MCVIVNVQEIIQLSYHNTFVSAIIHNTFATIPLSTIPYTDIPEFVATAFLGRDVHYAVPSGPACGQANGIRLRAEAADCRFGMCRWQGKSPTPVAPHEPNKWQWTDLGCRFNQSEKAGSLTRRAASVFERSRSK